MVDTDFRWFDEQLTRNAVRVGAIGLLGSIVAIAIALAIVSALPAASDRPVVLVLRVVAAAIRGFGIGFSILFSLLFTAGLFGTIVKEWRLRRLVALALIVVATGTFLFLPFCWNPKSDDCRSLAVRARDALSSYSSIQPTAASLHTMTSIAQ